MPLLRFYSPPISFEQRKIMAEEFSETLRHLTTQPLEQILIHFSSYEPGQLACEGRLIQETESPVYMLELLGITANPDFRELLSQCLLDQSLDLLGLTVKERHKIHIYYLDTQCLSKSQATTTKMAGQINP